MTEKNDWADMFPEAAEKKAEQKEQGFVFAQKYLVFEQDPRAKELLEHWTRLVRRQVVPPTASVQELAYWNSRREFVEGIHSQLELAHNRANQP